MAQANNWESVSNDGVRFYNTNILGGLTEWDKHGTVTDDGQSVVIGAESSVSFDVSNDFMQDSLSMSELRKIVVTVDNDNSVVNEKSDFSKIAAVSADGSVFVRLETTYSIAAAQYVETQEFVLSDASGVYDAGEGNTEMRFEFIASTFNTNILSQKISIINNSTTKSCTVVSCSMYRSQDSTQIGENTHTSMTVASIVAYKDGMTVQFDSRSAPIKMWWQQDDEGNFAGINVDGERMITFRKVNQSLPQ